MQLSCLYIYGIAHAVDSVEDHLAKLESADINPGVVALELPESGRVDGGVRSLLRESPATGIAWWYVVRRRRQTRQSNEGVSGRPDTEFEAGRRFADDIGAPVVPVDLPRDEVAGRYATWWRRIRDGMMLVGGLGFIAGTILFWILFTGWGLAAASNGSISNSGPFALLSGLLVIGYISANREFLLFPVGVVARWYLDRIREIRDEVMYDNIICASRKERAESVLLVVGAAHASGIASHAGLDGVEYEVLESPLVESYDGELDGITLEELIELSEKN